MPDLKDGSTCTTCLEYLFKNLSKAKAKNIQNCLVRFRPDYSY